MSYVFASQNKIKGKQLATVNNMKSDFTLFRKDIIQWLRTSSSFPEDLKSILRETSQAIKPQEEAFQLELLLQLKYYRDSTLSHIYKYISIFQPGIDILLKREKEEGEDSILEHKKFLILFAFVYTKRITAESAALFFNNASASDVPIALSNFLETCEELRKAS